MSRGKRKGPVLLILGLMAAGILQLTPAQAAGGVAGTDGGSRSGADLVPPSVPQSQIDATGCGDALDPILTNSRQAQVYQNSTAPTYTGVLDIAKYRFFAGKKLDGVNTDPNYINAAVELCKNAPTQPTDIPPGYQDITYYWVFQNTSATGTQNAVQNVGTNCQPIRANDLGPTSDQRISLFRNPQSGTLTCARAASPANEIKQIATGTSPVAGTNTVNTGPYVTRVDDHWWLQINVSFGIEVVGTSARLVGRWTYGVFEEFSQIYTSIDPIINTQQLPSTPNASAYVKTGTGCAGAAGTGGYAATSRTVCVRVPYAPRLDNGPDDDLLVDEARTNPVLRVGDTVQFGAVSAFGTRLVGLPFPVCPFSPTYPNPQGDPVALPGYPQNLPQADGGRFCRQGFVGLLTGHDWAPNLGFEGRAVPRSPSWAPGTTANAAQCQYPVGSQTFGVTAAPVIGGGNVSVDNGQFWISPSYQNGPPLIPEQNVPAIDGPDVPVPALTGLNVSCGYQKVITGLHYYPQGTPFFA